MDIKQLASMACIHIREDELLEWETKLTEMIALVDTLPKASGHPAAEHTGPHAFRADEVEGPYPREEMQVCAPDVIDGYYVLPRRMDEDIKTTEQRK